MSAAYASSGSDIFQAKSICRDLEIEHSGWVGPRGTTSSCGRKFKVVLGVDLPSPGTKTRSFAMAA